MPIYEFKCAKCLEISEFIFTSADSREEIKCGHCGGEDMERVISTANFTMGSSSSRPAAQSNVKTCGSGQCGTLEIPGIGD